MNGSIFGKDTFWTNWSIFEKRHILDELIHFRKRDTFWMNRSIFGKDTFWPNWSVFEKKTHFGWIDPFSKKRHLLVAFLGRSAGKHRREWARPRRPTLFFRLAIHLFQFVKLFFNSLVSKSSNFFSFHLFKSRPTFFNYKRTFLYISLSRNGKHWPQGD
jgi:hypothetical protein